MEETGRLSDEWMATGIAEDVDLIVFSDVFENDAVAVGATGVADRSRGCWTAAAGISWHSQVQSL